MKYALPHLERPEGDAAQQHRDDRVDGRRSAATASARATPRARAASSRSPDSSPSSTGRAGSGPTASARARSTPRWPAARGTATRSQARMKRDDPARRRRRRPATSARSPASCSRPTRITSPARSSRSTAAHDHPVTASARPWFGLFLPQLRMTLRRHPRAHARGRGRRLRLGVAHGPPRRAGRARARHVRGLDARGRARGADDHASASATS